MDMRTIGEMFFLTGAALQAVGFFLFIKNGIDRTLPYHWNRMKLEHWVLFACAVLGMVECGAGMHLIGSEPVLKELAR